MGIKIRGDSDASANVTVIDSRIALSDASTPAPPQTPTLDRHASSVSLSTAAPHISPRVPTMSSRG